MFRTQLSFNLSGCLLILVCMSGISCEREFNGNVLLPHAKPGIFCFLNNYDSLNKVFIFKSYNIGDSTGIYGGDYSIANATVILNVDNIDHKLIYDVQRKFYFISKTDLPILYSKNYQLKVWINNEYYNANCFVNNVTYPNYTFKCHRDSNNFKSFSYKFAISDTENITKYLLAETYYESLYPNSDTSITTAESIPIKKEPTQHIILYSKNKVYNAREYLILTGNGASIIPDGFASGLYVTDENIYKYYVSKNENINSDIYNSVAPIYTNINNGSGIFGTMFKK